MKIEIGESLVYSWLRHCKNCHICQTNWKVSPMWNADSGSENICQSLMDAANKKFSKVFKKTKNIQQLITQCEIDVIGIDIFNSEIFAIDVAFHSNGLNYRDTIETVTKKILRAIFALKIYFQQDDFTFNIFFLSPKVGKELKVKLDNRINEIKNFLEVNQINCKVMLLSDTEFEAEVLNPIISMSQDVADTSELFLRSVQLLSLFDIKTPPKIKSPTIHIQTSHKTKLAIGKFAQSKFRELLENNRISSEEINNLQDSGYSRKTFLVNYPILKKISNTNNINIDRQINGRDRYYSSPIKDYLLCNHWVEKSRESLEKWLNLQFQN